MCLPHTVMIVVCTSPESKLHIQSLSAIAVLRIRKTALRIRDAISRLISTLHDYDTQSRGCANSKIAWNIYTCIQLDVCMQPRCL